MYLRLPGFISYLLLFAAIPPAFTQQLPPSDRVTINLSAGFPGQSQWLYIKDSDSLNYSSPSYDDSSWTQVGIPYSANFLTSFLNADSGGGDGDLNGTNNWYRLHFTLSPQYAGDKVLVEFEGAHTGAQVYINGSLLPGISAVQANAQASHVVGFVPFIADLTSYVTADGITDNVLAVSVSRNNTWFEQPGFSQDYRFGQADAGLFRPVYMFLTNPVHIPLNIYSNQKTWGTYVATVSEVASPSSTAQAQSAAVEIQTNVLNESTAAQTVTLTTQIVDANGNIVASAPPASQVIQPMTSATFPSSPAPMFDQQITIVNPTLWYPNNSTYGTPYLYTVFHIVSVNGVVVDAAQTKLGIRTITWDQNFPYFNGRLMYLWGASGRYDYPALGSSVPEEQQWRDLAQLAAEGGNIWRPGHSTTSEEFVNAADEYGIMIDQPSGDGEGAFASPTPDMITLKQESHRDMIIRDRSHPSILDWEANNGTMEESVGESLSAIAGMWDPINTRVEFDRTPDPVNGYALGCTLEGCEVGIKQQFPNNPTWGAEYWGTGTGRGLAWDYELAFGAPFINNWRQGREANAFGMAQWYSADSPGEDSLYAEFQNEPQMQSLVRSLGASSVDMNRFPKLLYYMYEAAWIPFATKPVVHLAHHWNRSGMVQENVFSNCPSVALLINGVRQGAPIVPNPWNSDSSANLTQNTTLLPFQASWQVMWASGTVEAQCLDQFGNVVATDSRTTAGAEYFIQLSTVPELVKPDGSSFSITANGSDTAFITAEVLDANGNIVPTAADNINFSVSGPATYMGGSQQYVQTGSDAYAISNSSLNYHAPGDPELQAEGGMTKIALRSQFTPATITVTATAPGLVSGSVSYNIAPVAGLTSSAAPSIIIPPAITAVTVGQPATFSVTAAGTAPVTFQWQKNGMPVIGATGSTYTTPDTTASDNNAAFIVSVTNALGSKTSAPATLTVDPAAAVTITTQPASQSAYAGQSVALLVTATGSPTLSYQWFKNSAPVAGATGASYTTPALSASDNGASYTVSVSNPVNSASSTAAVITVQPAVAPTITQQPASISVQTNAPALFTVGVSGSSPFTYQWQLNGVNLPGATSSNYSILNVQPTNVGTYAIVVSNAAGSATSAGAVLTIAPPGINLALNQPTTASSSQGAGLTPNYVNDGSLSTRWSSAPGVDPSWVEIDLGSVLAFDNVFLYWENAYATIYQIQYSTDNVIWNPAYNNSNGVGGVENLLFPTVQGRYVRMYGTQRATSYGYSLYEMQVYDVPQCGGSGERFTILSPSLALDNVSNLTWQRAETTYSNGGAQYTQAIAQSYCASQNMRLPTLSEALAISGPAAASCAFPQGWNTWTSTIDPNNSSDAGFVTSAGQSTWQVAGNYPGAVLCTSGASVAPPTITTQPSPQSVPQGGAATFSVTAGGAGPFTYQWYKNGSPLAAAVSASYTTPSTISTDNGATFFVVVIGPTNETATSNTVTLTLLPPPADVAAIAAGGTGSGQFVADEYFNGGGTAQTANSISLASVLYPAPETIYQAERNGVFTYTIPGLTPGVTYPVLLHFAEFYWTTVGQRIFNVSINGSQVLTNFDIVAAAGGPNQAVIETFNAVATSAGQIVIAFTSGTANQPKVDGIEVRAPTASCLNVPSAPTNLVASGATVTTINLSWAGVAPPPNCAVTSYSVYRSTMSGFVPSPSNLAASGLSSPAYTDTGLLSSTTYYYIVEAFDSEGASSPSLQATGKTSSAAGGSVVVAINSGGPAESNSKGGDTSYVADEYFSGGGTYATSNSINITMANKPAPTAVYQSERSGQFTYTIPNLMSGTSYTVRLHFAEIYWTNAGQRAFNVSINGTQVLTNFDIIAVTGGPNIAVVKSFASIANTSGQIVISFTPGTAGQPKVSGVEIATSGQNGGSGPAITTQPKSQSVTVGAAATFSVVASGTAPLTYQWFQNGVLISGATSATYTTPPTTVSSNGSSFHVKVSNHLGSVNSATVKLKVTQPALPSITAQPTNQTAIIGRTATFSVTAAGGVPLSYQWYKNGSIISGAIGTTYTTPGTTAPDNDASFTVIVSNSTGSVTSSAASLSVNLAPSYTVVPGYIMTDLNNNTNGAWSNSQIYVEVLGNDPNTGLLSWVNYNGVVTVASVADNAAPNALVGPDGKSYPNYAFTLAQSNQLLLPPLSSGRIYISEGSPMFMSIVAGAPGSSNGYAGPNPLNPTDPNINTHYDWYEFSYGTSSGIFINTTQVDEFGLPLLLDVWGANETFHMQTGINESIAALDQEYVNETPTAFHTPAPTNLRTFSPANSTFNVGEANANYFAPYISAIWTQYATTPLTVTLYGGTREFSGNTSGSQLMFTEVNLNNGSYVGGSYPVGMPTTQDILLCNGSMATGNSLQLTLETEICAAFNRHVMDNYSVWNTPTAYYLAAPANYYAQFWHNHSVGGLAYGFAYDDVNNQSSTIVAPTPEHMAFGIGW